jgi:hypothetical protein
VTLAVAVAKRPSLESPAVAAGLRPLSGDVFAALMALIFAIAGKQPHESASLRLV